MMTGTDASDRTDHERVQEVLSAAVDGEQADEIALRAANRHADQCPECGAFRRAIGSLDRVPPSPGAVGLGDQSERPVRTVLPEPPRWMRTALWVFGAVNVLIGLPLLLRFDVLDLSGADASHLTRDGALAVVLGAAACATAYQPRWARPMSGLAAVVIVLNLLGGGSDVARGSVRWTFESIHVVNAVTAGVVIACAWWTRSQVSRAP